MPDTKVSALTDGTTANSTDRLPAARTTDGGITWSNVYVTPGYIKTATIGAGSVSIASGKTFTASNTLTLAGTDGTTMTFPSTSATLARTDAGNTFTGAQTFSVGTVNGTGLDISQTWTGTGTYTGLKYNVGTDSGPANAASLLLDLQVGGSSKFKVDKAGNVTAASDTVSVINATSQISLNNTSIGFTGSSATLANNIPLGWSSSGVWYGTVDTILTRAAAATLQLGAADAAGSAIAINSVASNQLTLASSHGLSNGAAVIITGTAAPSGTSLNTLYYARSISAAVIELYDTYQNAITTSGTTGRVSVTTAGTSASVRLSTPFQTFQPQSFTGTDIPGQPFIINGSRGTGTGAGGSIIFQVAPAGSAGSSQNAYSTALTIASDKTVSVAAFGIAGPSNSIGLNSGTSVRAVSTSFSSWVSFSAANIMLPSAAYVGWSSGGNPESGTDTYLYRDGQPNTLALRNGTNAQEFRVYGTTDGTNSEYGLVSADTGAVYFGHAKTGTGSVREIRFLNGGTVKWKIDTSGNFLANADNAVDIGASSGTRPRNVYVGSGVTTASGGSVNTSYFTMNLGSGFFRFGNNTKISDASDGVLTLTNNATSDFNRLQFGGTTSSFPALKRISSGNCLQVIAADNTASAGFIVGNQALATSATDGFLYVPTCAGTPTGTPTTQTGTAPIIVDTTNNKLYFYSGGQWRDAGP